MSRVLRRQSNRTTLTKRGQLAGSPTYRDEPSRWYLQAFTEPYLVVIHVLAISQASTTTDRESLALEGTQTV